MNIYSIGQQVRVILEENGKILNFVGEIIDILDLGAIVENLQTGELFHVTLGKLIEI